VRRQVQNGVANFESNGKVVDFATKALGTFKRYMHEGNPDLGIPVLDPVFMENFNYSLENNPVGFRMEINFDSPSLTGLSTYELNGANEVRNPNGDGGTVLQMTIVFPSIQIKGTYRAKGNMFGFFALAGQGDFEIMGSSQVLAVEAKLMPVNQTLGMEYVNSQFVGGKLKSMFKDSGTIGGPFPGLMSEFLSAMGTYVFDNKLKPVITVAMNDFMKEWLGAAFSSVSLSEILGSPQGNVNNGFQPVNNNANPQQQQQQLPHQQLFQLPAQPQLQEQTQQSFFNSNNNNLNSNGNGQGTNNNNNQVGFQTQQSQYLPSGFGQIQETFTG